MSKRKRTPKRPLTHEQLEGFDILINEFGQIVTSFEVDKLNVFLNEHTDDKKLKGKDMEEE